MYAIFVTINVNSDQADEFVAACIENGQTSVRDEPDCLRFEILRDKNDQNRLCFMEVFKNEQALKTHWETPHFAKMWRFPLKNALTTAARVGRMAKGPSNPARPH